MAKLIGKSCTFSTFVRESFLEVYHFEQCSGRTFNEIERNSTFTRNGYSCNGIFSDADPYPLYTISCWNGVWHLIDLYCPMSDLFSKPLFALNIMHDCRHRVYRLGL